MRTILTFLLAGFVADAVAQITSRDSVHLKPIGTTVSGSFVLVNRAVPLPDGEFALAVSNVRLLNNNKMVDVMLGQLSGGKLRAGVAATAVLSTGRSGGWSDQPCKRDDTLFRLNRVPFMKQQHEQNCLLVNHFTATLGQSATGSYVPFVAWLGQQGISTPIATTINASITRIKVGEYLAVHYAFNPEAFGCDATSPASWAGSSWHKSQIGKDAEKSRFVDSVVEFGKEAQVRIDEDFGQRPVAGSRTAAMPQPRCGAAVPAAPPAPSKSSSGSVADRLRQLENLKEQKLISPEEYDERRRKILDSL